MRVLCLSFILIIISCTTLIAQPITQTFTIPANQASFTSLIEIKEGQVFAIDSLEGWGLFNGQDKERDGVGKDRQGNLCNNEGGMVFLEPGGNYSYAHRNEGHGSFWNFAEKILQQKRHARSSGALMVKAFDGDGKYEDNSGSYKITVTLFPYDPQTAKIPRPTFHQDLAFHWAPVHYQDCAKTHWKADALTKINYDGDWRTDNNWNNLYTDTADLRGAVYYSVTETQTHWFIVYAFYHPRDWKDLLDIDTEHENDLEGITVLVRKENGLAFGKLEGIITVAHLDFLSYVPEGSEIMENHEDIDGKLLWETDAEGVERICTFQEAKGHGCRALQEDVDFGSEDDYFVYYPVKTNPTTPASRFDRSVRYVLVDIFEPEGLWERRFDSGVFNTFGAFHSTHGIGNANAPWKWDDWNDGAQLKGGDMAFDPALLFSVYYLIPNFSRTYIYNPYIGIW